MQNTWKKIAVGVSGAGVIALSGAALSEAQTGGSASPSNSSASSSTSQAQKGGPQSGHGMGHMRGTPVNASTLASLKKVVAAKAPGVTVERAFKAKNGTFHVMGTKAGKRVHVEVNAAMTTATVRQGGPGMHGGPGGPGGRDGHGRHRGVEVTGTKLTSVKNAIAAKAPGVTVEKVFQGPKGEFHAMGTKAGKHVMVHVSKDLKTVTVMTGGPGRGGKGGHGGPRGGHGPADWQGAASSSQASPAQAA